MNHNPLLFQVMKTCRSRTRMVSQCPSSWCKIFTGKPFQFFMMDKANLLFLSFPQAALGRKLIGDLLDMGIASLLTERHGGFD